MRIALLMDATQADKNAACAAQLSQAAQAAGHTLDNYGQYSPQDPPVTTITNAFLASALLAGGAADFIISGCGTGVGACMALNAMPNVFCGLVSTPAEADWLMHHTGCNCAAFPYAKGFGWCGEINLRHMGEVIFQALRDGSAAPLPEKLAGWKAAGCKNVTEMLLTADRALLRQAFCGKNTMQLFDQRCTDRSVFELVRTILSGSGAEKG